MYKLRSYMIPGMAERRKMIDIIPIARMGGKALQASRTPEQRSKAGRKAVNARWRRYREQQKAQAQVA